MPNTQLSSKFALVAALINAFRALVGQWRSTDPGGPGRLAPALFGAWRDTRRAYALTGRALEHGRICEGASCRVSLEAAQQRVLRRHAEGTPIFEAFRNVYVPMDAVIQFLGMPMVPRGCYQLQLEQAERAYQRFTTLCDAAVSQPWA